MYSLEALLGRAKRRTAGKPFAVALGAGQGGLGLIRGLGRAGIPVIALGVSSIDFGLRSRFCQGLMIADRDWKGSMLEALKRLAELPGEKVLIPDNDRYADFIYDHVAELEPHYRWPMPQLRQEYRRLTDKTLLTLSAEKAGVPTPATCYPATSDELASWCKNIRFPVVLKPVDSPSFAAHFKRKGFVADGLEQTIRMFECARNEGFEVIAQEVIPGGVEKLITVYLYRSRRGDEFVSFVGKKVRQYPTDLGTASLYASEEHPVAVAQACRLLQANDYHGVADIEFKIDPRDGTYRVIEVNGRIPMFAGIEAGTGVPLSLIMFDDLTSSPSAQVPARAMRDTRWVYALKDVMAALSLARSGEIGLVDAVVSHMAGPKTFAVWAADDPGPGLAFLRYLVEDAVAYARRRKVGH